jgi:hypothetical protein
MMSGRPCHPTGRARLRSSSGRSRPRHQAVRSPTPAPHHGAAAPRFLPTAHRHAGGRTPPETRPRRRRRAAAGPRLIAPCPTPGSVPARTGQVGVSQPRAHQLEPLRQVRASYPFGHAHHPPPRRPDRSSAQKCGRAFRICCPGGGRSQRRHPHLVARHQPEAVAGLGGGHSLQGDVVSSLPRRPQRCILPKEKPERWTRWRGVWPGQGQFEYPATSVPFSR